MLSAPFLLCFCCFMLRCVSHRCLQCTVHQGHFFRFQVPHGPQKPAFFHGTHLFAQNDGGLSDAPLGRGQGNMGGQGTLALPGGERQDDDGGAEAVAQIVLNDEHRALSSLLRADDGVQIGKIYVTAFHAISRSDGDSQRAAAAADGEGEKSFCCQYMPQRLHVF